MRKASLLPFAIVVPALLLVQGCSFWPFGGSAETQIEASSSSSSEESLSRYTDVSLEGTIYLQPGSQSAYELRTPGGSSFALVQGSANFADYNEKDVQVSGSLQESMDGSVRLLTVREITEIVSDSSSSESSSEAVSSAESSVSSVASSRASSASSQVVSSAKSSASSVAVSSAAVSSTGEGSTAVHSEEWIARMKKMARPRGAETWTQQYCSSHVGVCFPVRSDYWYRSFGASTGSAWHVELNSEEIVNLGDGPLIVDLVSGRLEGELSDGLIREADGNVYGYRSWTGSRYFRVSAPVELRASVEIITKGIAPFEAPVTE